MQTARRRQPNMWESKLPLRLCRTRIHSAYQKEIGWRHPSSSLSLTYPTIWCHTAEEVVLLFFAEDSPTVDGWKTCLAWALAEPGPWNRGTCYVSFYCVATLPMNGMCWSYDVLAYCTSKDSAIFIDYFLLSAWMPHSSTSRETILRSSNLYWLIEDGLAR